MDWQDIEAKLCERAEEVCRHLLPNGHREGANYVCGDLDGKPGDSLKVNLQGKAGVWRDFASDKGGKTLISLWCAVRGHPFKVCIVEAKGFLGIRDDYERRIQAYPRPTQDQAQQQTESDTCRAVADMWQKQTPLADGSLVWNYLVQKRCLDPAALAAFQVREFVSHDNWVMVFPYFSVPNEADTNRANIGRAVLDATPVPDWLKFERLDRVAGKKKEWTSRQPEKSLFGVHLSELPTYKDARHLLICEGEKDALTWASYGCHEWSVLPVSVPFGAKWKGQDKGRPSPNREWLDRCWQWMQGFETVFVAMDSDDAGKRAAADIITEIGARRCRLVELPKNSADKPYKDANDCLLAGVPAAEMHYALDNAMDFAPEKVVPATEFETAFMEEWFEHHLEPGLLLPFGFPWRIRMGELTVWTGIEKSGKTTLLSFCLMALIAQGERVFAASYEVKPVKTLKKYSRQAFGGLLYDKRIVDRAIADGGDALDNYQASARGNAKETFDWLAKNLWLYNHVGIGDWRQLLDDMRWARRRYGITQFVIDNFMRLGIAKDDYAQQADAITAFASLAMDLGIHIHVVVHQNKSEGRKGDSGGKRSVSGAFEIIANAHNIVEVIRDEKKGQQVKELWQKKDIGLISDTQFANDKGALDNVPDGKFVLHAQRDGEEQNGSKYLWFLWESQQYADKPPGHTEHASIRFVDAEKRKARQKELPVTETMDEPNETQ
jgi:twinkle protein